MNKKIAIIDFGSNSFHLLIVEFTSTIATVIFKEKQSIRLGQGLSTTQTLDPERLTAALACTQKFKSIVQHFGVELIKAVGTFALRTAQNRYEFIHPAEHILGTTIQIVSGLEEAMFIYKGMKLMQQSKLPLNALIIDIGGGSTELIALQDGKSTWMTSLPMGCVTFQSQYFQPGKNLTEGYQHTYATAVEFLKAEFTQHPESFAVALGASGAVHAVYTVLSFLQKSQDSMIHLKDFVQLKQYIEHLENDGQGVPSLSQERSLIFPSGTAILDAVMHYFHIECLYPVEGALREGIIFDVYQELFGTQLFRLNLLSKAS